ncbi:MAG: L-seryl-tRNA(Sec) selenium transferase [Chthonomonadales bacterium]|nr:L-seryl-tRNA(Sec) selenium transferase [Chthonomonadales bacterium]
MPAVARLLEHDAMVALAGRVPRVSLVAGAREALSRARADIGKGAPVPDVSCLARRAAALAEASGQATLRRAINATGIVLHTGLGRSRLAPSAERAVARAARDHAVLESDAETGARGSRQAHVRDLLRELTGAESALVVNNNAAAVLLVVAGLAAGREVVISRGELVEIGGAFRMPDIVRAAGAVLVEVGTTNRTYLRDYEEAITERTGLLLRCRPSNFRVIGFTAATPSADLAALGRARGVSVADDMGSGALIADLGPGLARVTTLRDAVASRCDVVTASGDKLLGGPQGGIVLGCEEIVERLSRHPLARAMRPDKLVLAGLEATLRLYRDPVRAVDEIPTLRYLRRDEAELRALARRLAARIRRSSGGRVQCEVVRGHSEVGGGAFPCDELPTWCVSIGSVGEVSSEKLAWRLRRGEPAVFGRVHAGRLLLDPRALDEGEIADTAAAVTAATDERYDG